SESGSKGPEAPNGTASPSIGIEMRPTSSDGAEVIAVKSGSPADGRLLPGDVIVELNHAPVRNPNDLAAGIKASPAAQPLLLRVQRKGQSIFVAIEPQG